MENYLVDVRVENLLVVELVNKLSCTVICQQLRRIQPTLSNVVQIIHLLVSLTKGPLYSHFRLKLFIKVKLSLCLSKHYAMKTYGGVDV
jgi:hypothetical protein